jgi:hypothetical protein
MLKINPGTTRPDVAPAAPIKLTDYETQLIASVRQLPAPDRANVSRSITYFCIAAADGFKAGGYSEGANA